MSDLAERIRQSALVAPLDGTARRRRVYLAAPVSLFGTPRFAEVRDAWELLGLEVVDPSEPSRQAAYEREGMDYFSELVRTCDVLAYIEFDDGAVGAGVAREILEALVCGLEVYRVSPPTWERVVEMPRRVLTIVGTRRRVHAAMEAS